MIPRRQLPVHSPLPLRALLSGAAALLGRRGAAEAVNDLLRAHFSPRALLRTDSGTSALTLALRGALEDEPGGVVALPAWSCYDLATAAVGAGARVALYDLDPGTLAPDPDSLRGALRVGARVVVVAHLYGVPVDTREVERLAEAAGAIVVDDAAQGAGGALRGRPLGAGGSVGVLSFGRGKGVTGGAGGALLANDPRGVAIVERARERLWPGRAGAGELAGSAAQWLLGRPGLYALPASLPFLRLGETVYRAPAAPRAGSAASSAILAVTWKRAEEEAAVRRRNAERLLAQVQESAALRAVEPAAGGRAGYLRLPLLSGSSAPRSRTARALGVMPGYPAPLAELPALRERIVGPPNAFPGARELAARLCTLPTHSRLAEADLRRLEAWIEAPH